MRVNGHWNWAIYTTDRIVVLEVESNCDPCLCCRWRHCTILCHSLATKRYSSVTLIRDNPVGLIEDHTWTLR